MKNCTKCKAEKDLSAFGKRYDYPNKLLSWCNDCERIRKRDNARGRLLDPEIRAATTLKQKLWTYGLTETEYAALVAKHNGRCAVCGSLDPLCIDHDHVTGMVRGLLCHHCNVGLGHFKDSPELIEKAIEYLCKNKNPHS